MRLGSKKSISITSPIVCMALFGQKLELALKPQSMSCCCNLGLVQSKRMYFLAVILVVSRRSFSGSLLLTFLVESEMFAFIQGRQIPEK